MKTNTTVPLTILAAGVIISGAIFFSSVEISSLFGSSNDQEPERVSPVNPEDDHILGNPDASIFIIEYSDTECPYCASFNQTMRKVMQDWGQTGEISRVFRHFPRLTNISAREAHALECVADQGGSDELWPYLNLIYERKEGRPISGDDTPRVDIYALAEERELDTDKMRACMESEQFVERITRHRDEANGEGAQATPFVVIELDRQLGPEDHEAIRDISYASSLSFYADATGRRVMINGEPSFNELTRLLEQLTGNETTPAN